MKLASSYSHRLLMALACFGCGSSEPEVPEPDAGLAPTAPVSVNLGAENPGVVVFSSEADGSLVETAFTDQEGRASLLVREGGMISFSKYPWQLITFLSYDTQNTLLWPDTGEGIPGTHTLDVSIPEFFDGTSYSVFACQDRSFASAAPTSAELTIGDDCLAESDGISVLGFVSDNRGAAAYARLAVEGESIDASLELVWETDFQEIPVEFEYPGFGPSVWASPVLQSGNTTAIVPFREVGDIDAPIVFLPPGKAEILWTDLTAYGQEPGWAEHRGKLPTEKDAWLEVPKGLVANHNANTNPELRWIPTGEGDVTQGAYIWDSPKGIGEWQIIATADDRLALFPELPDVLEGAFPLEVDPDFSYFYVDVVDFKDLDGFSAVLEAGRMSWGLSSAAMEMFLRSGGSLASATVTGGI